MGRDMAEVLNSEGLEVMGGDMMINLNDLVVILFPLHETDIFLKFDNTGKFESSEIFDSSTYLLGFQKFKLPCWYFG